MASLLPTLLMLTLAQVGPHIDVQDALQCVDSESLAVVLKETLPAPWDAADDHLALSVQVEAGPDGTAATLIFSLTVRASPSASFRREMAIIAGDCPSLPRLIAVIVGRHLAELPRDAWPTVAPSPPPPPVDPMPGAVPGPLPPDRELIAVTANTTLRLGFETGLGSDLWGGVLGADAIVGGAHGYTMLFGVEALMFAPLPVGEGAARLTTVLGRLGPAWEFPWQSVVLSFASGLSAGATIAQGTGFDRDVTTVGAAVRGWVAFAVRTAWGLSASLGGAVAIVRPQLTAPGAGEDGVSGSAARLRLSVGYTFGD